MEIYLTIDEYMDTFFNFFSAIGSFAAGFGALWAVKIANGYLTQHDQKNALERKRIAGENAFKSLIKTHQTFSLFFSDLKLKRDPKALEFLNDRNDLLKKPSILPKNYQRMLFTYEKFLQNYDLLYIELVEVNKDLLVNLTFICDEKLLKEYLDFDNSLNEIINYIKYFFPDSFNVEDIDFVLEHFKNNELIFPYNLRDKENELVREYLNKGDILRLSILEKFKTTF